MRLTRFGVRSIHRRRSTLSREQGRGTMMIIVPCSRTSWKRLVPFRPTGNPAASMKPCRLTPTPPPCRSSSRTSRARTNIYCVAYSEALNVLSVDSWVEVQIGRPAPRWDMKRSRVASSSATAAVIEEHPRVPRRFDQELKSKRISPPSSIKRARTACRTSTRSPRAQDFVPA